MYFTEAFQCRNMPEKPLRLTRINCGGSVSNVSVQGLVARAVATPVLLRVSVLVTRGRCYAPVRVN